MPRRRPASRRARPGLAALIVTVLLAACASRSPLDVVTGAPARTTEARTAKVFEQLRLTVAPGQAGTEVPGRVVGHGAVDFARRRAAMSIEVAGQEVEAVVSGSTVYQRVPALAAAAGGRQWLRIDVDSLGEAIGVRGLGHLAQGQSADPTTGLAYLRGATGRVEEVGSARVRGVETTRYRATVDVARAAAAAPADQRAAVEHVMTVLGIRTVPTEAWIDGDGRVRRVRQTFDYTAAERGRGIPAGALAQEVEVTLEFYDFGASVSASLPPAGAVADLADLVERFQRGQGSGTASPATDALAPRLLTTVPTGYERQPDSVGDTGPSDLDKAVRDDGGEDAREVLEADGFVAGYQRLWAKGDDAEIVVFLYEFRTPEGAARHLERSVSGLDEESGEVAPFAVPEIPGARGLRTSGDPQVAVVYLTRDRYLVQLVVVGPDAAGDLAVQLARQQHDRLG